MGDRTGIEWTDATWNPTIGCSRVSEGCRHCYAEQQAARIVRMNKGKPTPYDGLVKLVGGEPRWTGEVQLMPDRLGAPLRWRTPRRVFINSMSDLFHERLTNEEIAAVFGVMAAAPQHTFQILTKRARRMREWFEWAEKHGDGYDLARVGPSALLTCAWEAVCGDAWGDVEPPDRLGSMPSAEVFGSTWPLPNAWIGVSVENQAAAEERIPDLLRTPAAVRFLSVEPMLGPVDLSAWMRCDGCTTLTPDHCPPDKATIDWVIAGCESGPGARPADVAWYRSLRDQCAEAGAAFFLKQATEHLSHSTSCAAHPISAGPGSHRKPGGVIGAPYLDGVQHLAFPTSRGA